MKPCAFIEKLNAGEKQLIVTYGTSLTAEGAWVTSLWNALETKYPGQATVVNSGKNAMCSIWGLDNLQERVLSLKPKALFLEFSVNDAYLPYEMTLDSCRDNLNAMVNLILEANPGCEIILMIMNPMVDIHADRRPRLEEFNDVYRSVAQERGFMLIDHYPSWCEILKKSRTQFDQLVPDGAHPGSEGCDKVIIPRIFKTIGL